MQMQRCKVIACALPVLPSRTATEQHGVRRIIMGGDSLMRQQFMRLVSLLRHQTSTLDIGKWASVR